MDEVTGIYLTTADTPTAYIDPRRAEPGDLEYHELHLDGEPPPSRLIYAMDEHGNRILTASSDELSIFLQGRGPVTIDSVDLVS